MFSFSKDLVRLCEVEAPVVLKAGLAFRSALQEFCLGPRWAVPESTPFGWMGDMWLNQFDSRQASKTQNLASARPFRHSNLLLTFIQEGRNQCKRFRLIPCALLDCTTSSAAPISANQDRKPSCRSPAAAPLLACRPESRAQCRAASGSPQSPL